jgi:hypothetical protein
MRMKQILLRSGPVVAVAGAAVLPLVALSEPAAARVSGISVSTSGSTVSVTTSACTQINGSWGTASLLNSSQANFSQGRQASLSGTSGTQSASWSGVSPGTYTVIVKCSNNSTAGTQSVIVSSATGSPSPTASPTMSVSPTATSTATAAAPTAATTSPSRGVMGGLGGAAKDYGTLTLAVGGGLVATGVAGALWYLRKRAKPHRL